MTSDPASQASMHAGSGGDSPRITHTPGQLAARRSTTRTTVMSAPGDLAASRGSRLGLRRAQGRVESAQPQPPIAGGRFLHLAVAMLLGFLALVAVAAAILVLLLWQQHREAGTLTTQVERTWELFDHLRTVERVAAFAVVPLAAAWSVLATINVRRATGQRRSVLFSGIGLPIGLAGAWYVGRELVATTDDPLAKAAGIVLQAIFLAVPLLALERVAEAAEARHRPLRATYLFGVAYLVLIETLGGVSTVEATLESSEWSRLGAYLVIVALVQVLGALAASEAMRAIEDASLHRYEMRNRFGESLLAQAQGH